MGEIKPFEYTSSVGAPSPEEQANEQGWTLGDKAEYWKKIAGARETLLWNGYLTKEQDEQLREAISNNMKECLSPLGQQPESVQWKQMSIEDAMIQMDGRPDGGAYRIGFINADGINDETYVSARDAKDMAKQWIRRWKRCRAASDDSVIYVKHDES